jgi:hypothetical protein
MGSIRLDPETKFKWPEFSGSPLTDDENKNLKSFMQLNYSDILKRNLSQFKLAPCAGDITIVTKVTIDDKTYIKSPVFGAYTLPQAKAALEQSSLNEIMKLKLENLLTTASVIANIPEDITNVKKSFKECASESLFVIKLTAVPLYRHIPKPGDPYVSHANILVIAKNRGIVYWIEPQTTVNPMYENLMISSIKKLVTDIGMVDPTVINPVEVCPQALTKDNNCMFWSYVIFLLIMLNPYERDHNVLIKRFMEKYSTKEALTSYIDGFKRMLLPIVPPVGANRTRTYRKRRLGKKRRTTRRR